MTKSLAAFFASASVLSGCAVATVDRSPVDSPRGEVEFRAVRKPETLTGGYSLALVKDGRFGVCRDCDPCGPVMLEDLEPGLYRAVLRGPHQKRWDFEVHVRAGERTSIVVLHRNVLNRERAEEIVSPAGLVIVYSVGIPIYGAAWLAVECCTHWDEGDPECSAPVSFNRSPRQDRPAPPTKEPRFKNYKKP